MWPSFTCTPSPPSCRHPTTQPRPGVICFAPSPPFGPRTTTHARPRRLTASSGCRLSLACGGSETCSARKAHVYLPPVESSPGSPLTLRSCTAALLSFSSLLDIRLCFHWVLHHTTGIDIVLIEESFAALDNLLRADILLAGL